MGRPIIPPHFRLNMGYNNAKWGISVPCVVDELTTSPHESVYGVKPDYHTFFRIFSTGFFKHHTDVNCTGDGIAEAQSLSGIAMGRCCMTDVVLFYCPHTRHIYSSSDYKLD